jgi:hypothetical protein
MPTVQEARMRFCVLQVGQRGRRNKFWGEFKWRFWFMFFPWLARNWWYSGWFCMTDKCMYWDWINGEHTEGVCGANRITGSYRGYVNEHGVPPPIR